MRPIIRQQLTALFLAAAAASAWADVPGRLPPSGTVPNPGTQQQELANITAPAPYNTFEFVVTCAGCHGGAIDQNAGHFSNWAGTSMASATRDPVMRANQLIVNETVRSLGAGDGAGNMCFRCHSPNGWTSGRFDPTLAGDPRGTTMEHSILASTDDEGILCESCHRVVGNVTMKRPDLDPNDPVWNMMAGIDDWPHAGTAFVDQAGDSTIPDGNPYGDTTLQINDGMTYVGKYSGSVDLYVSDVPTSGTYTGQTYGIYPPGWPNAGDPVVNPDGSVPIHFEAPIGPPVDPATGGYDYQAQALSLEHPTVGDRTGGLLPQPVPSHNAFLRTSEFCGSCHELTVPVLNHGMPEQRTYSEWKYSDYGDADVRCQDCHMPTLKHEFADDAQVSLNPDPILSGWFPYGKDRNPEGGTAFHKFAGANRDLPMMMKVLYPEVDLEVLGAPTGNDPRVFPGMLSDRGPMWDRARRNTEIMLHDGVELEVVSGPTNQGGDTWQVEVKVVNNAGHKVPSGYPDGRRLWLSVEVVDGSGAPLYRSGYYDEATAELLTDVGVAFNRALGPSIDATVENAVMVYERVTGSCDQGMTSCTASPSLLNPLILFDNRIPPSGFDAAQYRLAGSKFWTYDATSLVPVEDTGRYPDGQNWDLVTYTFDVPAGAVPTAVRAEAYWQTHTREFIEHLKDSDATSIRPEGPPSVFEANYPLTPNYLSDRVVDFWNAQPGLPLVTSFAEITDLDGNPLNDNWGGIAYAAWRLSGMGAPYLVGVADSAATIPPAPTGLAAVTPTDPATGLLDPFTLRVTWDPVAGADGYLVWIRYGLDDTGATADWDRHAVVLAPAADLETTALNVGKTFAFKVQAFNGAGMGPETTAVVASTPNDLPLAPMNTGVVDVTGTTIMLTWFDQADNELGFIIERQDVPLLWADPLPPFVQVADVPSTNGGGTGGMNWTDTGLSPGRTYVYRVAAYNASGLSTFDLPVAATTNGPPPAPSDLVAQAASASQVDLSWADNSGNETGFRIERATDIAFTQNLTSFAVAANVTLFSDVTVIGDVTYFYRVVAFNASADSDPSNIATVTTPPDLPPAQPIGLAAAANFPPGEVLLTWTDAATTETDYVVERALGAGPGLLFEQLAELPADSASFTDTTVQPVTTYSYRVAARTNNAYSPYSDIAVVVTPGQIPSAPSQLTVGTVTPISIALTWSDNSTNEEGFLVQRSVDGALWSDAATLGINVSQYTDLWLLPNTRYWYRVIAFNLDGSSEPSEVVDVKTLNGNVNRLKNPFFNVDLSNWVAIGAGIAWNSEDSHGEPVSGSASLSAPGAGAAWIGQCVAVKKDEPLQVAYLHRLVSGDAATTDAAFRVQFYAKPNCPDDQLLGTPVTGGVAPSAGWTGSLVDLVALTGASSARVEFGITAAGGTATILLDDAYFGPPVLFLDGFEAGIGRWQTVP